MTPLAARLPTERQLETLYWVSQLAPATATAIGERLGSAHVSAWRMLTRLEELGLVEHPTARTWRLTPLGERWADLVAGLVG